MSKKIDEILHKFKETDDKRKKEDEEKKLKEEADKKEQEMAEQKAKEEKEKEEDKKFSEKIAHAFSEATKTYDNRLASCEESLGKITKMMEEMTAQ